MRGWKWFRSIHFIVLGLIGVVSISMTGCEKSGESMEVEGWVTDSTDKRALPGASIVVKGIQRGTSTDSDGHFKITAPDTAELVISFVGFDTQVRPIKGIATQMIALKANSNATNVNLNN